MREHTGYKRFIVVVVFMRMLRFFYIQAQHNWIIQHSIALFIKFCTLYFLINIPLQHSLQPYAHLSLYAIIDDHIGKSLVFVMEPRRYNEVELPIFFITPDGWEEER